MHPLTITERSYPVFLASQTAFVLITLIAMTAQPLRYGSHADFHLILLAVAPAIIVAGRIGLRVK